MWGGQTEQDTQGEPPLQKPLRAINVTTNPTIGSACNNKNLSGTLDIVPSGAGLGASDITYIGSCQNNLYPALG